MRNKFPIVTAAFDTLESGGIITLSPKYSVPSTWLSNALLVAANAGTAGFAEITFAGTYAVGDVVRVTLSSQANSAQMLIKSYVHVVQVGAISVTAVASAFAALITADINAGLSDLFASATNAAGVLTVTQAGENKKAIQAVASARSVAGTVAVVITATVYSEGQPSDLVDAGVNPLDITLASYDTVKIKLSADAAIPFIDSAGKTVSEITWYGTVGKGAALVTQVNT